MPKNGLFGFASAQTLILSLKSTGLSLLVLTVTGAFQDAPSSIEREMEIEGKPAPLAAIARLA